MQWTQEDRKIVRADNCIRWVEAIVVVLKGKGPAWWLGLLFIRYIYCRGLDGYRGFTYRWSPA